MNEIVSVPLEAEYHAAVHRLGVTVGGYHALTLEAGDEPPPQTREQLQHLTNRLLADWLKAVHQTVKAGGWRQDG